MEGKLVAERESELDIEIVTESVNVCDAFSWMLGDRVAVGDLVTSVENDSVVEFDPDTPDDLSFENESVFDLRVIDGAIFREEREMLCDSSPERVWYESVMVRDEENENVLKPLSDNESVTERELLRLRSLLSEGVNDKLEERD